MRGRIGIRFLNGCITALTSSDWASGTFRREGDPAFVMEVKEGNSCVIIKPSKDPRPVTVIKSQCFTGGISFLGH